NKDGTLDTGLFQWSRGQISLIARTGTNLSGIGKVQDLVFGVIVVPPPPMLVPNTGAVNNDLGQVLFGVRLTDGRSVMLLSTPKASKTGTSGTLLGTIAAADTGNTTTSAGFVAPVSKGSTFAGDGQTTQPVISPTAL